MVTLGVGSSVHSNDEPKILMDPANSIPITISNTEGGDGWKSIDVFYGERKTPEDADPSWKSQAQQEQIVAGLLREKQNGYFILGYKI